MSYHVTFVRLHEREQVEEIIAAACEIADDHGPEYRQWVAVFEKSVDLLGARLPLAPPQPVAVPDLGALRG